MVRIQSRLWNIDFIVSLTDRLMFLFHFSFFFWFLLTVISSFIDFIFIVSFMGRFCGFWFGFLTIQLSLNHSNFFSKLSLALASVDLLSCSQCLNKFFVMVFSHKVRYFCVNVFHCFKLPLRVNILKFQLCFNLYFYKLQLHLKLLLCHTTWL